MATHLLTVPAATAISEGGRRSAKGGCAGHARQPGLGGIPLRGAPGADGRRLRSAGAAPPCRPRLAAALLVQPRAARLAGAGGARSSRRLPAGRRAAVVRGEELPSAHADP